MDLEQHLDSHWNRVVLHVAACLGFQLAVPEVAAAAVAVAAEEMVLSPRVVAGEEAGWGYGPWDCQWAFQVYEDEAGVNATTVLVADVT